MKKLMMMAMVVAMGVAGSALAGTTIGYSGQLRDASGGELTTLNQKIIFSLYAAPNGGEALWTGVRNVVLSKEGYFNVELEDDTDVKEPLEKVLQENSTLYIGLKPDGAAAEIAPRQRILETPHAAVATAAKTGVDGFTVSGMATVTTLAATTVSASTSVTAPTVQAGNVQQQYTVGAEVKYGDLLPKGVIVMWNGEADKVPDGWALCNGQNNTPDLRGRFIVGYDPGDEDYKTVGNKGGEKTHKLTTDEMPKHTHEFGQDHNLNNKGGYSVVSEIEGSKNWGFQSKDGWYLYDYNTKATGGDKAHENRPPYYALCYIMKL